jgi:hypothetical protein
MIDITKLISQDTNIIEIYFLNGKPEDSNKMNILISDDIIEKIKQKFKITKETTLVYFNRNNLSYVYDLSNDSQFVYLRKLEDMKVQGNLCCFSFNEMKMQTHSFACTNDIDSRIEYKYLEFKINNRISLIIKNNNLYIHYRHSKEADLDKIQDVITNLIKRLNMK